MKCYGNEETSSLATVLSKVRFARSSLLLSSFLRTGKHILYTVPFIFNLFVQMLIHTKITQHFNDLKYRFKDKMIKTRQFFSIRVYRLILCIPKMATPMDLASFISESFMGYWTKTKNNNLTPVNYERKTKIMKLVLAIWDKRDCHEYFS